MFRRAFLMRQHAVQLPQGMEKKKKKGSKVTCCYLLLQVLAETDLQPDQHRTKGPAPGHLSRAAPEEEDVLVWFICIHGNIGPRRCDSTGREKRLEARTHQLYYVSVCLNQSICQACLSQRARQGGRAEYKVAVGRPVSITTTCPRA